MGQSGRDNAKKRLIVYYPVEGITQNKAAQAVCAFFIPLGARG